jgi:hypothetical protein
MSRVLLGCDRILNIGTNSGQFYKYQDVSSPVVFNMMGGG